MHRIGLPKERVNRFAVVGGIVFALIAGLALGWERGLISTGPFDGFALVVLCSGVAWGAIVTLGFFRMETGSIRKLMLAFGNGILIKVYIGVGLSIVLGVPAILIAIGVTLLLNP